MSMKALRFPKTSSAWVSLCFLGLAVQKIATMLQDVPDIVGPSGGALVLVQIQVIS